MELICSTSGRRDGREFPPQKRRASQATTVKQTDGSLNEMKMLDCGSGKLSPLQHDSVYSAHFPICDEHGGVEAREKNTRCEAAEA